MTTLFKQLEALSGPSNKALKQFRREYASREHQNRIDVSESWDYMLNLDPSFSQCEAIFRRCISDSSTDPLLSTEKEPQVASMDDATTAEPLSQEWANKEVEFMQEAEVVELEKMLQLFLDLSSTWLLHEQCQLLIDFLIYQYEMATRFSEMLLLALLPIHESAYYGKVASMICLPAGSELAFYVPARKVDNKKPISVATAQGVSREFIITATVKSFINYKRVSETVERITIKCNRGGIYVPLYTVLTVAFIEQNGKKLGDNEIRLLVNNALTGLDHPENAAYYSAQLVSLSLLFATIPVAIHVQRSVVTALLNPLLERMAESSNPTFEMRKKLKDSLLVTLGMLQQQKERLEVLPPETARLLLTVLQQFPYLANIFRGMGGTADALDLSRLCKLVTTSVMKAYKQRTGKPGNHEPRGEPATDLVTCAVNFFMGLDYSICYLRIMLTTVIDHLLMCSLSCKDGESLFEWDSTNMKGSPNSHHKASMVIYEKFLKQLYESSPSIFEDVLRRVVSPKNRQHEMLPVFLLICHCVSDGCPLRFTLMVHKCFGRRIDPEKVVLPRAVVGDNLTSTVLLYIDTNLPSASRVELYKMISSVLHGDALSSLDYGVLREFVQVSLSDPQCNPHFHNDKDLQSRLPGSLLANVLMQHIASLLQDNRLKISASTELKTNGKCPTLVMTQLYDKCFEVLATESPVCQQLLAGLSLFSELYSQSEDLERSSMDQGSQHFMAFLYQITKRRKSVKNKEPSERTGDKKTGNKEDDAIKSEKCKTGSKNSDSLQEALSKICDHYYQHQKNKPEPEYQNCVSVLMLAMDFMMRKSAANAYVNAESVVTHGNKVNITDDPVWCNEWVLCYALSVSADILGSQFHPVSTKDKKQQTDAENAVDSAEAGKKSSETASMLSKEQLWNLFALSEIVLGYAWKLHRDSIYLGDLAYNFARAHFKALSIYALYLQDGSKNAKKAKQTHEPTENTPNVHAATIDRGILLFHTILSVSSDEMAEDFKEALSKAPKGLASSLALWLQHLFEFGRLVRSRERRTGSWLDLYSKIEDSYIEIVAPEQKVRISELLCDSLQPGLTLVFEALKGVIDNCPFALPSPAAEPLSQTTTMRIHFTLLFQLDTAIKMYSRGMDLLSHVIAKLLRLKTFSNAGLMLDVLANALELVLDKELSIRRPAVSMLFSAMKTYIESSSESSGPGMSICGYQLCRGYTQAVSSLGHQVKGLGKSMQQLCKTMIGKTASSTNSMFASQLLELCASEPTMSFALMQACVFSGTTLQFNLDLLKRIISSVSSDSSIEKFGESVIKILSRVEEYTMSSPTELVDLMKFLLCLASLEASVSLAKLKGTSLYFATTLCPAIFRKVALLFDDRYQMNEETKGQIRAVRSLISLCAVVATSALSGVLFWNLKGDAQSVFLESFDKVFAILDAPSRQQCLRFVTSGFARTRIGVTQLVSTFDKMKHCKEDFMEQFILGTVQRASPELQFEAFSSLLDYQKQLNIGIRMPSLILQRFVTSTDLSAGDCLKTLCKGCASLFDRVVQETSSRKTLESNAEDGTTSSLISNFVNVLYRRLYRCLGNLDIKALKKLNSTVIRFLKSLAQFYGAALFDFVQPWLYYMFVVGETVTSISAPGEDTPAPKEPSPQSTGGCALIYETLMCVLESDKSAESFLKFVELSNALIEKDDRQPLTGGVAGKPELQTEKGSFKSEVSPLYDAWVGYSLYTVICIGRFPRDSPPFLRCIELLKRSRDTNGILARVLITVISSNCEGLSEYLGSVPTLDLGDAGTRKHLTSCSGLETVYETFVFIKELIAENKNWFEIVINAESFNNFKSAEYHLYRSVSLLIQGVTLSLVCFKVIPKDDPAAKLKKKQKGPMGMCTEIQNGDSDHSGQMILQKANEILRCIYEANPQENHPRIALGALSLFRKIDNSLYKGNYWDDLCELSLQKRPWVCEYVSSSISFIANSFGNRFTLAEKKAVFMDGPFSKELFAVVGLLVRVLADFIAATDVNVNTKKPDEASRKLVLRSRKTVWRCLIGLCGRLPSGLASPGLSLMESRLDILLQQKASSQTFYLDLVNSMKICIRLVCSPVSDLGQFDLSVVHNLSSSLAKFTVNMLQRDDSNDHLHLCVVTTMLLLRSSFGRVTGDELLEAILNVLLNYQSKESHHESFPLPEGETVSGSNELKHACRDIFEELLSSNSEKFSTAIHNSQEKGIFNSTINCRVLTLLSFYASISCKYHHLLRLVLGLDFTQVELAMRYSTRLLSIISINLYYNRIKSKHLQDLEKIYFLNVKLLSDFEAASVAKGTQDSSEAISEPNNQKGANSNTESDRGFMGSTYIPTKEPYSLHLSSGIFSNMSHGPNDCIGSKSFEDSIIAFALQYFSKLKPGDLVELLANHMRYVSLAPQYITSCSSLQKGYHSEAESVSLDGTRLFLRLLSVTLREYGSVGATQFVLPRVYQFLNTVLDATVKRMQQGVNSDGKEDHKTSYSWKYFINGILVLHALSVCVETWDSQQASVPDMFLNTLLPTIGKAINLFDVLDDTAEQIAWEHALENLFMQLIFGCSAEADRIELVLSGNLVYRSTTCKCRVLRILHSLWNKASFHLGGTVVNVMPMLGELVEDESTNVQRLAEELNDKIQSFLNTE